MARSDKLSGLSIDRILVKSGQMNIGRFRRPNAVCRDFAGFFVVALCIPTPDCLKISNISGIK